MSHVGLPLAVQTSTSVKLRACVETEVNAGILRAVLTAGACWDTESTTEQSPSTQPQTTLFAKVKQQKRDFLKKIDKSVFQYECGFSTYVSWM